MKLKDDLPFDAACEKYLHPMLATAEQFGRFDIIEGAFLAIAAICELNEDEQIDIYMKLSTLVHNRAAVSNRGLPETLAAAGYDQDRVKELNAIIVKMQQVNGVQ